MIWAIAASVFFPATIDAAQTTYTPAAGFHVESYLVAHLETAAALSGGHAVSRQSSTCMPLDRWAAACGNEPRPPILCRHAAMA
jgi:hypothetical protein